MPCGIPEIALAFDLAVRPDSARAYYERYIDTPFLPRIGSERAARERLGRLGAAERQPG